MRVRLAAILVVLALIILIARRAHASCAVEEAYLARPSVPVGCHLFVYLRSFDGAPRVVAIRDDQRVDVTGASTSSRIGVPIFVERDHCTGNGTTSYYDMNLVSFELAGVVAGDTLEIEGVTAPQVFVTSAETCSDPIPPSLYCADDSPAPCPDETDDDGGCSSATPALGAALAVLGLVYRRRKPSRS